jgi:hypothetical protein
VDSGYFLHDSSHFLCAGWAIASCGGGGVGGVGGVVEVSCWLGLEAVGGFYDGDADGESVLEEWVEGELIDFREGGNKLLFSLL